jgi:hypothetical protein
MSREVSTDRFEVYILVRSDDYRETCMQLGCSYFLLARVLDMSHSSYVLCL